MEQKQEKKQKTEELVKSPKKTKVVYEVKFEQLDINYELLTGNSVVYEEWFKFIQNKFLLLVEKGLYEEAEVIKGLLKEILALKEDDWI